jgi:streptogramin lyase
MLPEGSRQEEPSAMVAGPDGEIWFVNYVNGDAVIGQLYPRGALNEFELPDA